MNDSLIGNPLAKTTLCRMVKQDTVPHTLLFFGLDGIGKKQFAFFLAELLMGKAHAAKLSSQNHPDLHLYLPEGKSCQHPIEKMRELIEEVSLPPFEAPVKLFIIDAAHQMSPFSSNALLKTLEEPPENTYFVLLTDAIDAMLPTVLSRCQKIPFFPIPQQEIESFLQQKWDVKEIDARRIAFTSYGSLGKAHTLISHKELSFHKPLLEILNLELLRDYPKLLEHLKVLEATTEEMCEKTNLSQLDLADAILEEIIAWYRDLILVKESQKEASILEFLYHRDQLQTLKNRVNFPIPALERVFEEIDKARLSLQRSTKLRHVLENFFLSLLID